MAIEHQIWIKLIDYQISILIHGLNKIQINLLVMNNLEKLIVIIIIINKMKIWGQVDKILIVIVNNLINKFNKWDYKNKNNLYIMIDFFEN